MFNRQTNRKRKGQSAIEYLTTYGWALLAIGVVAAFLLAGPLSSCPTTKPRFSGQVFTIESFATQGDSNISIGLTSVNKEVNVTGANVTAVGSSFPAGSITIGEGQTEQIVIDLDSAPSGCFKSKVEITYDTESSTDLTAISENTFSIPFK